MLAAFTPMTLAYTAPPVMGADAPIKLGVNGFGRIGRQVVRACVHLLLTRLSCAS